MSDYFFHKGKLVRVPEWIKQMSKRFDANIQDWEARMDAVIEEAFSSPEKLHEFLDETDFDLYHDRPREDYFPMLKKKVL